MICNHFVANLDGRVFQLLVVKVAEVLTKLARGSVRKIAGWCASLCVSPPDDAKECASSYERLGEFLEKCKSSKRQRSQVTDLIEWAKSLLSLAKNGVSDEEELESKWPTMVWGFFLLLQESEAAGASFQSSRCVLTTSI